MNHTEKLKEENLRSEEVKLRTKAEMQVLVVKMFGYGLSLVNNTDADPNSFDNQCIQALAASMILGLCLKGYNDVKDSDENEFVTQGLNKFLNWDLLLAAGLPPEDLHE